MKKQWMSALVGVLLTATISLAQQPTPTDKPLTPEQQSAIAALRAERKAVWEAMTPQQREAAKANRHARMKGGKGYASKSNAALTPQQAEAMKALREARKAEWEAMTPQQREEAKKKRMAQHQAIRDGAAWNKLTPQQQATITALRAEKFEQRKNAKTEPKHGRKMGKMHLNFQRDSIDKVAFQRLTPQQQATITALRAERKAAWDALTPEQRKQQMEERRKGKKGK